MKKVSLTIISFVIPVAVMFLLACSNSVAPLSPEVEFDGDAVADDMYHVRSKGMFVTLGTDDATAKADERPQMKVSFDYDFDIGSHEVTCGEFNELMQNEYGLVLDCEDKQLPAVNITYYDAVLFSNARSKALAKDTAYTYVKILFDVERHCIGMEGLAFHPEANAFRLPTEAEWSLVAFSAWNPQKSWFSSNSGYRLHPVCTSESSKKGIPCDMAGNAMEWVNDWSGNFKDTVLQNYVGAPDGGGIGKRIVKGGSWRNDASLVNIFSRGDIYTVTSSTRADYVGFRLAYGSIPNPSWMGNDGVISDSRIIPLTNSSSIKSFMGTYKTILAFRNDVTGNLAFIDYSFGNVFVIEIKDTLDSYHPDISPDGGRVAFCTGLEGVSGESSVYVRDLNENGSNLVKLDVESAAIPRWRVLENGDTVIVYVTSSANNKDASAFAQSATWQVKFSDGKFGVPEKLFDGAYHGGVSYDNQLAVTGARLLRARVHGHDTVWYGGEQACNVSLAKDSSKRTLFLDFGGTQGRQFAKKKYSSHEVLLIADSTGKLKKTFTAPIGMTFDHTEWVNDSLVVATLVNDNGAHVQLVALNVVGGTMLNLAEGSELWHPCLWVRHSVKSNEDFVIELDSAGVYLSEFHDVEQSRYRVKMGLYWKNLKTTEVILFGSSRMERGVNPDLYLEWNMLNMAVSGIDPVRDMYFIRNYVFNHSDEIKAIVFSIDLDSWRGLEDHLSLIVSAGPGYVYDMNHNYWADYVPESFLDAVENSYPAEKVVVDAITQRGGFYTPSQSWNPIEILVDSVYSDMEMENLDFRLDHVIETFQMAKEKNIYFIGIIFPLSPEFKNTGSFGPYGLQRSEAQKRIERLDSLDKAEKYFILMDENKMGNHDYSDEMAFDDDHLSSKGAEKMTARLVSILKTLE